jgi:radical SAM superfamily enzyme YgiQ (UPF0313 family)
MKILLLNAPVEPEYRKEKSTIPLGLISIAHYINKKGIEARLINLAYASSKQEILKMILPEQPDIIGISFYTSNRLKAYSLSSLIRKHLPKATIVIGGHHASCLYKQLLDQEIADFVVIGEGEHTFYELVTHLHHGQPSHDVPGLAFYDNQEFIVTPKRGFIENLDTLYSLDDKYIELDTTNHTLSRKEALSIAGNAFGPFPWQYTHYALITTRGCPFSCGFCASFNLGGGSPIYWRGESPKRVVDKLEFLYHEANCRFISFFDNSFNIKTRRVVEICEEIIRRNLKLRWWCSMRTDDKLNPYPMLKKMKQAGCWSIHYGVESGSSYILKMMNKKSSNEQAIRTIAKAKQAGISTHMMLIVGYHGETDSTIRETLRIIEHCKPETVKVQIAMVFPGTKLYKMAEENGLIFENSWLHDLPSNLLYPAANFLQASLWLSKVRFHKNKKPLRQILVALYMMKTILRRSFGIDITLEGVRVRPNIPPLFSS